MRAFGTCPKCVCDFSYFFIFLALPKLLSPGKDQIYLAFFSLIRNFASKS
jgi:hypothetical protein